MFARIVSINAAILMVAGLFLALSPATVSDPISLTEVIVLVAGLSAILLVNLFLVSRAVAPLENLTTLMGRVDILRPGFRVPVSGDSRELRELGEAFNAMLDRLESERRQSARRTLALQEEERLRVARELHDEVGQTLTGVLLQHEALARRAPDELQETLQTAREIVRSSLDNVRRISSDLRPGALEHLGLARAVEALAQQVEETTGIEAVRALEYDLPDLDEDVEVVVYRVAQEGLTNVVRHADAARVEVRLGVVGSGRVRLAVLDDGRGLGGASEGDGVRGMRERAMLIGADLSVEDRPGGGVEVQLEIPSGAREEIG